MITNTDYWGPLFSAVFWYRLMLAETVALTQISMLCKWLYILGTYVFQITCTHTHTHTTLSSSGVVGNGLCVFSRFPIVAVYTHQFSVSGGVYEVSDGEMLAGKGIMCCRIQTPEGQITFFNTHVSWVDCIYRKTQEKLIWGGTGKGSIMLQLAEIALVASSYFWTALPLPSAPVPSMCMYDGNPRHLSSFHWCEPRTQAFSPQCLSLAVLMRGKAW